MALPVLQAFNAPAGLDETNTRMWLRGLVIFTAQAYVLGGLLPVYNPINDASGAAVLIPTLDVAPATLQIYSRSGSGYVYGYNKASGKIQIFTTGTATQLPLAELAAGVLPAGVIADVVEFVATYIKA